MSLSAPWSRFGAVFWWVASLVSAPGAEPASPSPSHSEILRRMPAALLSAGGLPPANTDPSPTSPAARTTVLQASGLMQLALAAARGDQARAEEYWPAAEAVFAHQKKNGGFDESSTGVAFRLCELSRTLLVIQQSPLAARFRDRIVALEPALTKAAAWLAGLRSRMLWEDRATPDALFAEAEAFLFCGQLLGDKSLTRHGEVFLDKGMKLYRPSDGVFLERNGVDAGFEAACLVRLQEIVLHQPDRGIDEAIAKGVQWELAHIGADGVVRLDHATPTFFGSKMLIGPEKEINFAEIGLALLYYHGRTGDPASLAAVQRLQKHYVPTQ